MIGKEINFCIACAVATAPRIRRALYADAQA
jgi:hypothetical protein